MKNFQSAYLLFTLFSLFFTRMVTADTFTTRISQYNDQNIVSLYANTNINDHVSMSADLDSSGYLGLGLSYGDLLGHWYTEGFINYGNSDLLDIYDAGALATRSISQKLDFYLISYHQWRKGQAFPILELEFIDKRTWVNSLGLSYKATSWLEISCSTTFESLLSGKIYQTGLTEKTINSQDITLTYQANKFELFARYTIGTHRVRPSEPITRDNSYEVGLMYKF